MREDLADQEAGVPAPDSGPRKGSTPSSIEALPLSFGDDIVGSFKVFVRGVCVCVCLPPVSV